MSEVLARLRVRETHGIRRFLYPLKAYVPLPEGTDISALSLTTEHGEAVPLQVTPAADGRDRLDFALSLDPLQQDVDLVLKTQGPQAEVPDPLSLTHNDDGTLRSVQERFQITLRPGGFSDVVYDGIPHLTPDVSPPAGTARIERRNPDDPKYKRGLVTLSNTQTPIEEMRTETGGGPIAAWSRTRGVYSNGCAFEIDTEITACKSWVMWRYRLEQPQAGESVSFIIPLEWDFRYTTPQRKIFDTGVNGVYGQFDYFGHKIYWKAPTAPGEPIRWEIAKDYPYRLDYVGQTASEEEFERQRWFHLIDERKSVAVAMAHIPAAWRSLEASLAGYTHLSIGLGDEVQGPVEFGVCCHFLNDVPAIAAATNPQSILLPPVVEVLPT